MNDYRHPAWWLVAKSTPWLHWKQDREIEALRCGLLRIIWGIQ